MAETYESSAELAAERGGLERLNRIHWVAQELIKKGILLVGSVGRAAYAKHGDIRVNMTEFREAQKKSPFPTMLQLDVKCRKQAEGRVEPDKPVQLCIEFGAQPEQFRLFLDGRSVWKGGKQILPAAHGATLEILHLVANILEREQIREIQAAIRADLEQRGIRMASLEVVREELAESERPAPKVTE